MKTLKLFIAIVLIVSIVGGVIYWQSGKEPGTPKPSPSVSEKPTETTKPSPEPTTSTPKPTTPEPEPTIPSPEPTTPEPEPVQYTITFDSNITAKVGGMAITSGDKVKTGSMITFTARAISGKTFSKFYNGAIAISGSNPCNYAVTADMSVTATYTTDAPPPPPPVQKCSTCSGAGRITCSRCGGSGVSSSSAQGATGCGGCGGSGVSSSTQNTLIKGSGKVDCPSC